MVNHATVSMTGFASRPGSGLGFDWTWDIRSVNGKGLDLRLRLPEWIEGLEQSVRARLAKAAQRGNVTVSLRLSRADAAATLRVHPGVLAATLGAMRQVDLAAQDAGVTLAAATPAEVLALRGVMDAGQDETDLAALTAALLADLDTALDAFTRARAAEGKALARVVDGQVAQIAALVAAAAEAAEARRPALRAQLDENLARVMAGAAEADPQRVAQELAMLVVKADVTEEIDRLRAHVESARALLTEGGAVGRKLDFLMQEFMREANTLCSKSGDKALTRIGLDLKTVIDQMREQVQNVE